MKVFEFNMTKLALSQTWIKATIVTIILLLMVILFLTIYYTRTTEVLLRKRTKKSDKTRSTDNTSNSGDLYGANNTPLELFSAGTAPLTIPSDIEAIGLTVDDSNGSRDDNCEKTDDCEYIIIRGSIPKPIDIESADMCQIRR